MQGDGEAPAEPQAALKGRLSRSFALPIMKLRRRWQRNVRYDPCLLTRLLIPGRTFARQALVTKATDELPTRRRLAALHLHAELPRHPSGTTDGDDGAAICILICHFRPCMAR